MDVSAWGKEHIHTFVHVHAFPVMWQHVHLRMYGHLNQSALRETSLYLNLYLSRIDQNLFGGPWTDFSSLKKRTINQWWNITKYIYKVLYFSTILGFLYWNIVTILFLISKGNIGLLNHYNYSEIINPCSPNPRPRPRTFGLDTIVFNYSDF